MTDVRSYDLIQGEWVEIGETAWGKARAMPIKDGEPKATVIEVDEDGNISADGPTTIQYYGEAYEGLVAEALAQDDPVA